MLSCLTLMSEYQVVCALRRETEELANALQSLVLSLEESERTAVVCPTCVDLQPAARRVLSAARALCWSLTLSAPIAARVTATECNPFRPAPRIRSDSSE